MAAEAYTVVDATLDGRHYAAASTSAIGNVSSRPQSGLPIALQRLLHKKSAPLQIISMPSAVTCSFVAEGSANAVFCVTPADDIANTASGSEVGIVHEGTGASAESGPLSTHLLRIPKAGPGVSPTTCIEHHAYYCTVLRPLLGAEWLVGQHLIQGVVSSGVDDILNSLLADLDRSHRTRPDWVGTRVAANVDVALLVEDMTSACKSSPFPSTTTTIQCKPKWLVQSPSAPAGARRCRTCALAAASAAPSGAIGANGRSSHAKKASPHKIKPCPLVLVADRPTTPQEEAVLDAALWDYVCQHMSSAVTSSSSSSSSTPSMALRKARPAIVHWLRTTDLFLRMAAIQADFDPRGALSMSLDSPATDDGVSALALDRLQIAMTLRDCTCFLRVTTEDDPAPSQPALVSAKLGDLDRKNGRHKLAQWQEQERILLAGGFYLGTEEPRQQTQCWLERRQS
ncbi:Inositol-pentakisphosphate 2-kinase [Sporothrix bragantina]|uniref:Inositol-pentakisphosphate 2-kinase n=1 Tax=Sporothrix bragantina TaxID=671064 RepID=A0ABP0AMN5_9PEZI